VLSKNIARSKVLTILLPYYHRVASPFVLTFGWEINTCFPLFGTEKRRHNLVKVSFKPFNIRSFAIWVVGSSIMIPLSLYVTFLLLKVSGLENYEDGIAGWIFVPFSIMFIFGLQWLILRRHISKATKWIWGNISALILGGLLIAVFSRFTTTTELPEWSLMAIPAISYGLLMGLAH
jgi:hypothetical protein